MDETSKMISKKLINIPDNHAFIALLKDGTRVYAIKKEKKILRTALHNRSADECLREIDLNEVIDIWEE